ncbi:MAG: hypothetical protein AABW58_01025 [Nanoarchaeota archaeon]
MTIEDKFEKRKQEDLAKDPEYQKQDIKKKESKNPKLEAKIRRKLEEIAKKINHHRGQIYELQKEAFMYEDPLGYYRKFHSGVPKGKLCDINQKLYRLLREREIVIFGERKFFANDEERMGYYHAVHEGKERGQLFIDDPVFYEILRRHKLLRNIPPFDAEEPYPFEADPVGFYLKNLSHLTRDQLKKTPGYRPLHRMLEKIGKLDICAEPKPRKT